MMTDKLKYADLAKAFEALKSFGNKNHDDYYVEFFDNDELIEQIIETGESCKKK